MTGWMAWVLILVALVLLEKKCADPERVWRSLWVGAALAVGEVLLLILIADTTVDTHYTFGAGTMPHFTPPSEPPNASGTAASTAPRPRHRP